MYSTHKRQQAGYTETIAAYQIGNQSAEKKRLNQMGKTNTQSMAYSLKTVTTIPTGRASISVQPNT